MPESSQTAQTCNSFFLAEFCGRLAPGKHSKATDSGSDLAQSGAVMAQTGAVMAQTDVVSEGMAIVLDVNNGERLIITQITKKTRIKVGKSYMSLLPLIGHSFGTIFETTKGKQRNHCSRTAEAIYDTPKHER